MNLNQKIIKPKLGLLELAKSLGNISAACKTMGYSRDSYYRFQELYENGGDEALYELTRKKPILANRVDPNVEKAVLDMAIEYLAWGQLRVSNELKQKGILVSPGGVRSIGSVASVSEDYKFERYGRIPDILRHQICKIVERRLASSLIEDLSFLNHANVFNS